MASLRGAINAMCRACICDSTAYGSCAQQVEACTSFACPLWDVRPTRNTKHPQWVPWTPKIVAAQVELLDLTEEQVLHWSAHPRERPPGYEDRVPGAEPVEETVEETVYDPEDDPDSPI